MNLKCLSFALPKPKVVLDFRSGWTQVVKNKLPVALALVRLSSAPEPAITVAYNRNVGMRQREHE